MSRIGRMPITVPAGVDVKIESENTVTVKGPLGTLTENLPRYWKSNVKAELSQ